MGEKTYRTRIDAWLAVLVGGGASAPLLAAGWLASTGRSEGVVILGVWGTLVAGIVVSVTLPLRYTLGAEEFRVRSGWLRWSVPLASIRRVTPTWNPLSSPAWSLRRVRIEWGQGDFILVSPEDRELFIDDLAARCPHLIRAGAGLELRPPPP